MACHARPSRSFILCIAKAGKDNMQLAESLTYCALVFAFGPLGVIPGLQIVALLSISEWNDK